MLDSCLRAGRPAIADIFVPDAVQEDERLAAWQPFLAEHRSKWATRYGLRLSFRAAAALHREVILPGILILVGDKMPQGFEQDLRAWKAQGRVLCWEYSPGAAPPVDPALLHAIVVRGCESGGASRDQSVRTLFDLARKAPDAVPLVVQGVGRPEPAAVFIAMGAAGVILDAALFYLPDAPFPEHALRDIRRPREGGLRRRKISGHWVDVHYVAPSGTEQAVLPLGPGLYLASDLRAADAASLAARFRQEANAVLCRLMRVGAEELASREAQPFLVQGPMAGISTSVGLAAASAGAGFFPVFSLTGLSAEEVAVLAAEITAADSLASYGLGIAGPTEFTAGDLEAGFGARPPAAIALSGDCWPFRGDWQVPGTQLWLHVQTPEMLATSAGEGHRHFILEGSEAGGHVGHLPATVLWSRLLEHIRAGETDAAEFHLLFAGGIHSPESALFCSLLAAAFEFRGSISLQLGTPVLLTHEAVQCGAIHPGYRRALCKSSFTEVAGPGTGSGVRLLAEDVAPVASQAEFLSRYRQAVEVGEGTVLAGECIAHFSEPVGLEQLAGGLGRYTDLWRECRGQIVMVESLDFRVTGEPLGTDLAVVGIGAIFPGAADAGRFWANLRNNERHIAEVPPEHWGPGHYREDGNGNADDRYETTYSWHAGIVKNFTFDRFDCLKYHIAPKSVEVTDKIHLMLLKAVGEALESAGADFHMPEENTVVLIGNSMGGERAKLQTLRVHLPDIVRMLEQIPDYESLAPDIRERIEAQLADQFLDRLPATTEDSLVGLASSTLAGRVASYLNVFGGNFAVDAACAASLAGLGTSVEMLNSGTCACAVVGGVDSDLSVGTFINFCKLHALAHGISRPFMVGSDGFTMGEGAGVIFLKPLEQAMADGDRIYARVAGVGMSSDGRAGSMTMPSSDGQILALRRAFAQSGFAPESIGFIETHGTGTIVGDAAELQTLHTIFESVLPGRIALGSVKSHVGHLKSAAGIASLIKAILALYNRTVPPAWIEGEIRPELKETCTPFRLPSEAEEWPRDGFLPRRAAVSSFGFGGSNFHVHLEEMNDRLRRLTRSRLLLFSGRDEAELAARLGAFERAVAETGVLDLAEPAQVACLGGSGVRRLAAVWNVGEPWSHTFSALRGALSSAQRPPADDSICDAGSIWSSDAQMDGKKLAFLFPGQGSALHAPFRQLVDSIASFRHDIERYCELLGMDLVQTLWPDEEGAQTDPQRLADPALQPGTTALSLALARMLRTLGIVPDAVGGHSLGFYGALAVSGVLDESQVLRLVRERATCFGAMAGADAGCMLALAADEERVLALAAKAPATFYAANFNSPDQTVVSLRNLDLGPVVSFLEEEGVGFQPLPVGWGFHSPLMTPAAAAFAEHLGGLSFRAPWCDLYSETTGMRVPAESFAGRFPEWLPEHITRPVRFAGLIGSLAEDSCAVTLEVGARGSLSRFAKDTLQSVDVSCFTLDSTSPDVVSHLHEVLASLYVDAGVDLDLGGYLDVFAGHLRPVRISGRVARRAWSPGDTGRERIGTTSPSVTTDKQTDWDESDETYLKVRAIVAMHSGFEEEQIASGHLIQETLGVDSLKMVEIGLEIERTFGISVSSSALPRSLSVGGLAVLIGEQSGRPRTDPQTCIGRYVLTLRPVPLPSRPDLERGSAALLTDDPDLAAVWTERDHGPVIRVGESRGDALDAALTQLGAGQPEAIVYAARAGLPAGKEDCLERVFLPAYKVAHDYLPRLVRDRDAERGGPRFLTAAIGPECGFGGALLGFSRSLQLEWPEIRCGHVTIREAAGSEVAVDRLWNEISASDSPFRFVSYADNSRFVEELAQSAAGEGEIAPITGDDVILATGGGHGITAEILAGLSRDSTPSWIITGSTNIEEDSPQARSVETTMRRLRELDCEVEYVGCDFSDPAAAQRLAGDLNARASRITGIVHGAGVLADAGIASKPLKDFMRVLSVKAGSAMVLQKRLDLSNLRFWINMSSIAAYFGNHGQTDYAAANVFLNEQAAVLREEAGIPAKAVMWSPWTAVGMAAGAEIQEGLASRGIAVISPEDGTRYMAEEVFDRNDPVAAYCGNPVALAASVPVSGSSVWVERRVDGTRVEMVSRAFGAEEPFLLDHRIRGVPILPGAMAVELSAAAIPARRGPLEWRDLALHSLTSPVDGALRVCLGWTAQGPECAGFEAREARGGQGAVFAGTLCWKAAACPAPQIPETGARRRLYREHELYGEVGLLFSGNLFRVLGDGTEVLEHGVRAKLRGETVAVYAGGSNGAGTPLTSVDGLFQMAALYCHAHGLGIFLPVGISSLWWSGSPLAAGIVDACLWPTGVEKEHRTFDAAIFKEGSVAIILRSLKMARTDTDPQVHQ